MGEQTLNFQTIFEAIPGLYAVLTPDFAILTVSDAYLQAAMRKREDIVGHIIFDAFPDNPADLNATGVKNLRASLESVLKHRKSDTYRYRSTIFAVLNWKVVGLKNGIGVQ